MSIAFGVYLASCVALAITLPELSWKRLFVVAFIIGIMITAQTVDKEQELQKKFAEQGMFLKEENK